MTVTSETTVATVTKRSPSKFQTWYGLQRGRGALEVGVMFLLIQGGLILWYLMDSVKLAYLDRGNLGVMSQSIGYLALLTIGSGIVMMVGEIDLSVGANMGMSAIVFLTYYSSGHSAIFSMLVCILVGTVIGIANGLLVNYTHIPSLIATLGMVGLLWAAQIWYAGGDNMEAPRVKEYDKTFEKLVSGNMFAGIRAQFAWLLLITAPSRESHHCRRWKRTSGQSHFDQPQQNSADCLWTSRSTSWSRGNLHFGAGQDHAPRQHHQLQP
jgi:ABC-type xylose transport system permease subunit